MSARLTPGGALLRSSRMFTVPNPLPQPGGEVGAVARRLSPSATTDHPTHQAITTPESSRKLGDWGFKRSLPIQKTIKTSTPIVRIKQIDTVEGVTDYKSAADHAITLQKFQEMSLPVSLPSANRIRLGTLSGAPKSVFEDETDFTTLEDGATEDNRWKFQGPWLASLTQGEFDRYLSRSVRNKREEFRTYLREVIAEDINKDRRQAALDRGNEAPESVTAKDITEDQLLQYQRKIRSDRVLLFTHVSKFLDLAPLQPPVTSQNFADVTKSARPSIWAEVGPPKSHPSAGLSYLRTSSFAENHPVYGPQAEHTPVLARIIAPRQGTQHAKLGVAGFVTDVPLGDNAFNERSFRGRNHKNRIAGITSFDPDVKGGAKAYVKPVSAFMSSVGRILIGLDAAEGESQSVLKEMYGKEKIYNDKDVSKIPVAEPRAPFAGLRGTAAAAPAPYFRTPEQPYKPEQTGSKETYGIDLS
ncbi:hypothetical protein CKAH01_05013 [Colletotrichum kahawae]|uniref:Uncharacterized protein n=1 Tax=Colletotrichum kahawae TaxID=34407 RepID=A0AAD9YF03_COLKA|nr:hypothetical protein CKAH01_05013 [Colletotrichum kahawae]